MLGASVCTEGFVRSLSRLVPRLSWLCCVGSLFCSSLSVVAWGQQPPASSDPFASLRSGSLTVWESYGSQAPNWATAGRVLAADFPQLHVNFRLVAAQDFIYTLALAGAQGSLPDIVYLDNWGQGGPLIESQSVVELLMPTRFPVMHGWWFLMMQGAHPLPALAFLRWLNDDPHWTAPQISTGPMPAIDREQSAAAAVSVVKNLAHNIRTNPAIDPDAALSPLLSMGAGCGNTVDVVNPAVRFIFGNGNLAIAELAFDENVQGGQVICTGLVHAFLVLRKRNNEWKVLYLWPRLPDISMANLLKGFASLPFEKTQGMAPPVPSLITQQDAPQKIGTPHSYELSWRQDQPAPAAYIVERQAANLKGNELTWGQPQITFVNPMQDRNVVSQPMIFAVGVPMRWRVWAIGKDGQIALSEWRTLQFTN